MKLNKSRSNRVGRKTSYTRNQGVVVIMLAVGLTVLLTMVGMAIDFGHAYLNKTRLQNIADSLVLSGAKILNDTRSVNQAQTAIVSLFDININSPGNSELKENLTFSDLSIEYSDQLYPFQSPGNDPRYVRVKINSLKLQSWFIQLVGFSKIPVSAASVAGPSSTLSSLVCDSSAIMLCGDSNYAPSANSGGNFWGYVPGAVQLLKAGTSAGSSCLGPGNYQLVSLGDENSGAAEVREILAGNYESCTDFSSGIQTKPGNSAGPSIQGLNTRFGDYQGPMKKRQDEFPPDVVTTSVSDEISLAEGTCQGGQVMDLDFSWQDYKQAVSNSQFNFPPPVGVVGRRILKVPIGDCSQSNETNGRKLLPYLGLGCFFLLKKIDGKDGDLYGEFIEECMQDGVVGPQRESHSGPYKIILHESPTLL